MTKDRESRAAAAEPKKAEQKTCFVIGPIGSKDSDDRNSANMLFENVIRPVAESASYAVTRADKIEEPGMIDDQIIVSVLDADLVIADLKGPNANALYELALRHAAKKPAIHMTDNLDKVPFDIGAHRAILYSLDNYAVQMAAREELKNQITAVSANDYRVSNPVIRAVNEQKFFESTDDSEDVGVPEMIREILYGLNRIERKSIRRSDRDMFAEPLRGEIHVQFSGELPVEEFDRFMMSVHSYARRRRIALGPITGSKDSMEISVHDFRSRAIARAFDSWLEEQPWAAVATTQIY